MSPDTTADHANTNSLSLSGGFTSDITGTPNPVFLAEPQRGIVFKQIAKVGKDLKAVAMKNMQRFKARHIYDVYNMLQPLLAEHGLSVSRDLISDKEKEVVSKQGAKGLHRYQLWRFIITAEDGSIFKTTFPAESIDYGDKAASQCDAMAFKQMLLHTFLIPTDQKDPDDKAADHIVKTNKAQNRAPQPATKQPTSNPPTQARSAEKPPEPATSPKNWAPGADNPPSEREREMRKSAGSGKPMESAGDKHKRLGEFEFKYGKFKGQKLKAVDIGQLQSWCDWVHKNKKKEDGLYRLADACLDYIELCIQLHEHRGYL